MKNWKKNSVFFEEAQTIDLLEKPGIKFILLPSLMKVNKKKMHVEY